MKKVLFSTVFFLSVLCNYSFAGETNDTLDATFKVNGNAACKSSIESILVGKEGVISAVWDASTKMLSVKYIITKIPLKGIHSYLATAGYDTADFRAKQQAYDALPQELKYVREPITD